MKSELVVLSVLVSCQKGRGAGVDEEGDEEELSEMMDEDCWEEYEKEQQYEKYLLSKTLNRSFPPSPSKINYSPFFSSTRLRFPASLLPRSLVVSLAAAVWSLGRNDRQARLRKRHRLYIFILLASFTITIQLVGTDPIRLPIDHFSSSEPSALSQSLSLPLRASHPSPTHLTP